MTAYGLIAAKQNGTFQSLEAKGSENNCLFGQVVGMQIKYLLCIDSFFSLCPKIVNYTFILKNTMQSPCLIMSFS